jgi:hypothetical protein
MTIYSAIFAFGVKLVAFGAFLGACLLLVLAIYIVYAHERHERIYRRATKLHARAVRNREIEAQIARRLEW